MSKCEDCPISGPCIGERPGKAFACKLAAGSESERRWVEHASGVLPPAKPPLPPRDLSAYRVAKRLGGRNCWYAGKAACGCLSQAKCYALGKDVTIVHCAACLKEVS